MVGPNLNNLLKWSVESTVASRNDEGASNSHPATKFDGAALGELFGAPRPKTVTELMTEIKKVLDSDQASLEAKVAALERLKDYVTELDLANNLKHLEIWLPLIKHLDDPRATLRALAAWCCTEAVQNNIRTQEELLGIGAIPTLVKLATEDSDFEVRKKAVGALSAVATNYQLALDEVIRNLPAEFKPQGPLDAGETDSIALVIKPLRASNASLEQA